MSTKKAGFALTVLGSFLILISLIADFFVSGDGRLGAQQLLGVMGGVFISLFGLSAAILYPDRKFHFPQFVRTVFDKILNLPVGVWVVLGFLIVYVLFYIFPVFLNHGRSMEYFIKYIPDKRPIGSDLRITMDVVTPWVTTGESPYPHLFYPPLTYVLFAPLALVDYPASYMLITFMTIFSFFAVMALMPFLVSPGKDYSMLLLFLLPGLLSYGFQFELERGQFNVITFFVCVLALYIFYRHYEFRYIAYLLFSISIQIKVYPAIFILLFIRDWRDWAANIKRWVGLGLFNILLLFVLGYQNFLAFFNALMVQVRTPSWGWNGNHSVQIFVFGFLQNGYGLVSETTLKYLQQNAQLVTTTLLLLILGCILAVVIRAYLLRESGFNPYLFFVCTLGALTIPTSNDYTLPILAAPTAMFFYSLKLNDRVFVRVLSIVLVLIIAVSYASILYPFKYKPLFLSNSFPPLLVSLIAGTILYFLRGKPSSPEIA